MSNTIDEGLLADCFELLLEKAKEPVPGQKKWTEGETEDLYQYAYHFYKNGKYEEAADFFRTLTSINCSDRHYWIGLAGSLKMLKKYKEAIDTYAVAAVIDSSDPLVHAHAADCCFAAGEIDRGIQALESAESLTAGKEHYQLLNSQLAVIRQAWCNQDICNMEL